MEGDSLCGGRSSIRDKGRGPKKYGSTSHVRNTTHDTLVRHDVSATDTLQGIALKYGSTTEQIRRTNRLYASDSLFSKPHLMIPVSKGSPYYPKEEATSAQTNTYNLPDNHWPHSQLFPADNPPDQRNVSVDYSATAGGDPWDPLQAPGPSSSYSVSFPPSTSSSSCSIANNITAPAQQPKNQQHDCCLSPEEEHKKDLDELLGKIDSTIANSRRFVAKSQDSSDYATMEEDCPDGGDYYDGAYQNASSHHRRNVSGGSAAHFHTNDDTLNLITSHSNSSRQVKSSLRRLEQTQDELFEL